MLLFADAICMVFARVFARDFARMVDPTIQAFRNHMQSSLKLRRIASEWTVVQQHTEGNRRCPTSTPIAPGFANAPSFRSHFSVLVLAPPIPVSCHGVGSFDG